MAFGLLLFISLAIRLWDMLEGPWYVVLCTANIHTWLQWQGIDFDGSAGLFPCNVPKDLSYLPAELIQHLLLIPEGGIPVQDQSLSPSAFLCSSMESYMTNVISFPRNNNGNPLFYCTFPLNASSTNMSHSFSLAFLKVSCFFAKQENSLVLLSSQRHLKNKVVHSTLNQHYSERWIQSIQQIFYHENY